MPFGKISAKALPGIQPPVRLPGPSSAMRPSWLMGILVFSFLPAVRPAPAAAPAGIRVTELRPPSSGRTGFTLLAPATSGVAFTNRLDDWSSAANRVLNNGSGVATGDFDRDGQVDLFFCSLAGDNRLFQNLGDWQFQDVTSQAGLRFSSAPCRGAVFADLNGDGWLDLLIGVAGSNLRCLLNDQHGRFVDATANAGLRGTEATETIALADVDGNGTLDVYVANNRTDDIRDWPRVPVIYVNRKPTVPPQLRNRISLESGSLQEFGEPDVLFLNDGQARFRAASWTNGTFLDARGQPLDAAPLDWGLTAAFRDLNHDGAPDLYVCNDYWTPDRLWWNDGHGGFRAADPQALRKFPASSMGVDFADVNRDGHPDIFAVDMLSRSSALRRRQMVAKRGAASVIGDINTQVQTPRNVLLLNRGDGTFAEIACLTGLDASEWSWSPVFLDVDLDGYDDLLVTAGHLRDIQDIDANDRIRAQQENWRRSPMAATNLQMAFVTAKREHARLYPPLAMPVIGFHNRIGRGEWQFEETTSAWGLEQIGVNHGIALADLDQDGDLDLIVNRLGSAAALFRNDTPAPRILVQLRGRPPNTQAIGARIELLGASVSNQVREITSGGSYMSGHDTARVFAPGTSSLALRLRVTWRDGHQTEITNVLANRRHEIDEALAPTRATDAGRVITTNTPPLFEDISSVLRHRHAEAPFDDFARQPLLPRRLSQGGPAAAWFDFNGDGWDDLMVGTGRGGFPAVFVNRQGKAFSPIPLSSGSTNAVLRDQTGLIGLRLASGAIAMVTGTASYEDSPVPGRTAAAIELRDPVTGGIAMTLPGPESSVGPVACADVDGDGDLDLFVGGQNIAGRYPQPASSILYLQDAGRWAVDTENTRRLSNIGLVNSAVWTDLDGDGHPELVLACEWGAIRTFENRQGRLTDVTQRSGLAEQTGLWQSVTAGDFDGDGRPDLVAGNWGLNSPWHASPQQPLVLVYGDLAGRGGVDLLETEYASANGPLVPRHLRDTLTAAIPWLAERFPTHARWGEATIEEIIADRPTPVQRASAVTLRSMIFLNRGNRFEARPLPIEAQFSPVFGLCVADFDGDGHEDLALAQNFFAFRHDDARLDAGRGLVLRGDGQGNFAAMSGAASGLRLPGEQRAIATADIDHDGRPDLLVTQNGSDTALLHNRGGRTGVRVRLRGPTGNTAAIGASVRARFPGRQGPAREIRAGGGWWSQDSSEIILAMPEPARAIEVRWPGGKTTEHPLPPGAREMTLSQEDPLP